MELGLVLTAAISNAHRAGTGTAAGIAPLFLFYITSLKLPETAFDHIKLIHNTKRPKID
jgi:hypothetical protein